MTTVPSVEPSRFTHLLMKNTHKKNREVMVGLEELNKVFPDVCKNTLLNWARRGRIPAVKPHKEYFIHMPSVAEAMSIPSSTMEAYYSGLLDN